MARDTIACDLFVVGGGINGVGVARDAVGRGLSVVLAEMDDLASATSSASTKLFHGGLRYLEYFELRLVREALIERETLLRAMPHISWPMRFVLPYHPDMRFEASTPLSRLLGTVAPWMRGRRPAWLIRLGLFLYDTLGGRKILPPTATLDLRNAREGTPLQERFEHAFEYSDCWVQDTRLVTLNARDAAERGATILTRAKVVFAERVDGAWRVVVEDEHGVREVRARALVNAGGPWVGQLLSQAIGAKSNASVRLVRGSHIVTRKLYDHDKCYLFQGADGRVVFAIPFEEDFTLIGTTDEEHPDPAAPARCTDKERRYLIDFVNDYLASPISERDVVWSYSGVRPLYDDGARSATAATRDYTLTLEGETGAPLLNIFGGKITTYRRLAEAALDKLAPYFPGLPGRWTAGVALPGGDFAVGDADGLANELANAYGFVDPAWARRLIRCYGTDAARMLDGARSAADLGTNFGATLTEREVAWLIDKEFARTGDDVVWRRTKLGLRMSHEEIAALDAWMQTGRPAQGLSAVG
ncbi:glycerol-3-phosphate dehydrogenase [Rhodobacterales bacterium HKCCE3408]|nr:glycerol-3-phosphate dehydrogenase [Rhodobacterales bacterium HKCCE3408]